MMAKKENKSKNTGADSGQLVAGGNRKIDPSAGAQGDAKKVDGVVSGSPTKSGMTGVSKRPLYVVAGIVLLLGVFGWMLVARPFEKPVAQVDGHKIYKRDTEQMTAKNKSVSTKDAAVALADKYLTQAMAEQQNVQVSQADLEQEFGEDVDSLKTSDPYTYQANVNSLYFKKLAALNAGAYKGKYVVAHFSRNIAYDSPLLAEQKRFDPSIGDPAAIAADKAYAQKFINNLYAQVASGKMTFDQAIEAEHKDSYLGENAYQTLSHSKAFDTSNTQDNILNTRSITEKIHSIKPGTTTKPFAVKVSNSDSNDSMVESFYLMVQMDSSKGGNSGKTFDQVLKQQKQELGYTINV